MTRGQYGLQQPGRHEPALPGHGESAHQLRPHPRVQLPLTGPCRAVRAQGMQQQQLQQQAGEGVILESDPSGDILTLANTGQDTRAGLQLTLNEKH